MADEKSDQTSDFDRLARRYLDLWQSQLSGLAADQSLTEQIARLFAAANAQVAAAMPSVQQGASHGASTAPAGAKTGTATSAAAPRHGADDVGELRKRVAALEARIAELEAKLDGR